MKQKMNSEEWIEAVLQSTKGMTRADAGADFYGRIKGRLHQKGRVASFPSVRWAAAAFLVLAINTGTIAFFLKVNKNEHRGMDANPFAKEMISGTSYNY